MHADPTPQGTIPVREGEALDTRRVLEYLRSQIPDLPSGELQVRQFPTGASNLTYWIRVGEWEAVLRRPPVGPVPPKAHDMEREGRLLQRLHAVYPLAPNPFLICSDPAVLGVPFHVMEYRRGVVMDSRFPPEIQPTPESCRVIAERVVDTLVTLHDVDYRKAGLEDLGKPEGFLGRQVAGWIGRYEKAQTDEIPEASPLMEWLRHSVPESPAPTVIHNDFKLNNLLFDPTRLEVAAVLDWEMATIGDPLFDLAIFLSYWVDPSDPESVRRILPNVSGAGPFPTRAEMAEMYAIRSGRDLRGIDWYQTFAYFKLAVILQQIYARWVRGQTRDPRFEGFGASVRALIEHAHSRTGLPPARA
jgi:aminoglycoside phosphotransferase (APT) family kinase protein